MLKTNIFQDYLLGTNDFRESIYKDEPIVPENKTHIVNYEWTNAPSTETIPESGKHIIIKTVLSPLRIPNIHLHMKQ